MATAIGLSGTKSCACCDVADRGVRVLVRRPRPALNESHSQIPLRQAIRATVGTSAFTGARDSSFCEMVKLSEGGPQLAPGSTDVRQATGVGRHPSCHDAYLDHEK